MSKLISGNDESQAWVIPEIGAQGTSTRKKLASLAPSEKKTLLAELDKAKKKAYEEGFKKGQKEGLIAAKNQIDQMTESLVGIMNSLVNPTAQMEDRVEEELVKLSVLIAKQIVRRELKSDPGQVIAVVREALSILPSASQNVKVHLNPADAELVRKIIPSNAGERKWEIVEDPVLSPGSCQVETDTSQVDASFEARLAAIAAELLGNERRQNES